MKIYQTEQTNLPPIKLPNERIPIVKHILKDEESSLNEVIKLIKIKKKI